MKTKYLLVFSILLISCGGENGNKNDTNNSVSRSLDGASSSPANESPTPSVTVSPPAIAPRPEEAYANSEKSLAVCRQARAEFIKSGSTDENQYIEKLETIAQAAEPCAEYGLGLLYVTGYESVNLTPDKSKAQQWLQKAAAQQHLAAIKLLSEINN